MEMPVINSRLYMPKKNPDDPNEERMVQHPETNSEQVYMKDNRTLEDFLGPQTVLSAEMPKFPCIWAQIRQTRFSD